MPPPYFTKSLWPDFTLQDQTFSFAHLSEAYFAFADTDGQARSIIITYGDHVFTRDIIDGDDLATAFPGCSRTPTGFLCPTRYRMSLRLPALIPEVIDQRVWQLFKEDSYAQLPIIDDDGTQLMYAIVFALHPIRQPTPHDLRMHIRSAYICDVKPPDTFGDVKFGYLAKLRMQNQHPEKIFGTRRKKPQLPL